MDQGVHQQKAKTQVKKVKRYFLIVSHEQCFSAILWGFLNAAEPNLQLFMIHYVLQSNALNQMQFCWLGATKVLQKAWKTDM